MLNKVKINMAGEVIELIIFKYLSGSASEEEAGRLVEWLKQSRENRITYFTLRKIWYSPREEDYSEQYIDDSWNRLKPTLQIDKKRKDAAIPRTNFRKLAVAATILVLIGVSSFLAIQLKNLSEYDQTMHISVPLGARSNIILPDGTNVWLNAGSNLTYKSDFGRNQRSVFLNGEAYFDVNPARKSVFTVNTRDLDIKVHGTQFNVKSYHDEDVTETTLVSGLVEISITDPGIRARPVHLEPNQRVVYSRETRSIRVEEEEGEKDEVAGEIIAMVEPELPSKPRLSIASVVNIEQYTSWKDGRLTFNSECLETLAPKIERFYNVNITFLDDSIKTLRYTGTLEEVTIEEVMRAIVSASDISFTIEKNKITLSK
jgi:transmembrane sensor